MKKIFSILIALALLIQSTGIVLATPELELSDTTRISSTAENCYAKVTKDEFYGDDGYSLHMYTTGDYLEISQDYTEALSAGTYTLTYYGKGTGMLWFYSNWGEWMRTDGAVAEPQSNEWTKYTYELTIDGSGDTSFLFHNNGSIDFYLDEISLVDADGIDYIIDGGFNEVTGDVEEEPVIPDEPDNIPDEDLTLSNTTRISSNTDSCYARVTDDEKYDGDYSLHFKTGGDWLEVTQDLTETAEAGSQYVITAYVKPVSGIVWFRIGWDDTGWLASHQAEFATELDDGWIKLEKEVTLAANQTSFLFHNDTSVEFYIDGISLKKVGDDTELLPDGSFEEVTVAGSEAPGVDPEEPPLFDEYETIILASSDFQNTTSSEAGAQTVANIINAIEEDGLLGADAFFCCGDYANTYNETEENLNILKETVSDFVPDADSHVYVQGNHDAAIGTQGLAQSGNNDPENGEYGVFVINEDDYMWNNSDLARIKVTAGNLADYLNEKLEEGFDKPIFVLSHLPLYKSMRTTNDGDAQHANQLFHVLNQAGDQGLNIIFMSGHDHSSGYESYLGGSAVYLAKGDSINIPQGSKTSFRAETLNFTYMNAGYIGYCNSSADSTLTMTLFGIDEDTDTVDVFRYDTTGLHNLKSAGVLKPEEETAGEYEVDATVYTSPQSISLTEVDYEYDIETLGDDAIVDININDSRLTLSDTTKMEGTQTEDRYIKVTDNDKKSGDYSLHVYSTTAGLEFGQNYTENLPAGNYTVTWYAKGSDGIMSFWSNWGECVYNNGVTPVDAGNGWIKYTANMSIDGSGDTRFLFYTDTTVDCYIDDISLIDENGINYIIDGGFEEVTVAGGEDPGVEPDEPTGDRYPSTLILSDTTVISGAPNEDCYVEATDNEFYGDDGFGLHFGSSGDANYTVSQITTEPLEAGESYVLTVYGKKVSGRVWFRAGWGDDAWMVAADDGEDAGNGWKRYQKTLTIDSDGATNLFFYSDQETEFYLDDISLVKVDEEENLMPDGGFSEVTVIPPEIPDYEVFEPVLKKGTQEFEDVSAIGTYTVSVAVKNNAEEDGLPVEVLVAVFDSEGVMVNLYSSDVEPVEMTEPNAEDTVIAVPFEIEAEGCSIDVYVINNRQNLDVYYNPINY